MTSRDISNIDIYYFNEVNSTMDKAKELIKVNNNKRIFSVIAGRQNMGRGTRGRKWLSSKENGNLYMTVVYKMSSVPVPITLMPLRVATLIAPCIEKRITSSSSSLYLKWPNDVLIDNEKVCGILIEIEDNSVLVGIGCNVLEAPKVDSNGAEGGRASTSISKHNQNIMNINNNDNNISTNSDSKVESLSTSDPPLLGLAVDIVEAIDEWLQNEDTASSVLKDFEDKMTPVAQRVRTDRLVDESLLGKEILPLRLNSDGSLVVRVLDDNRETTLVADYLW